MENVFRSVDSGYQSPNQTRKSQSKTEIVESQVEFEVAAVARTALPILTREYNIFVCPNRDTIITQLAVVSLVQAMVWLPVFGVLFDVCNCTQGRC